MFLMSKALAQFMGIAITAIVIVALVFGTAKSMLETESNNLKTEIETEVGTIN